MRPSVVVASLAAGAVFALNHDAHTLGRLNHHHKAHAHITKFPRRQATAAIVGLFISERVLAADQQMRTSSDFASFEALTGQSRSANLGPGTISGKSRPETGVILSAPPESTDGSIFANVILDGGICARIAFTPAPGVKLAKGMYYDVEARSKMGDSSYLQVVRGNSDAASLVDAVLQPSGRYGAFGPPTDVKILHQRNDSIDIAFSAIAPGGSTTPRRATIAIAKADGSKDLLLLVNTAGEARWKSGGDQVARAAASSFRVDAVRPTKLTATKSSDFRFEEQGGFR